MTLARKISLSFGAMILFTAIGTGMVLSFVSSGSLRTKTDQMLQNQLDTGAELITERISGRLAVLEVIADDRIFLDSGLDEILLYLEQRNRSLGYLALAYVDSSGMAHYSDNSDSVDLHDREYIIRAMEGESAVSDVLISRVTNSPVVMMAVPVKRDGKTVGAVLARSNGDELNQYVEGLGFGDSGTAYLLNPEGVVIAHKDNSLVLNRFSPVAAAEQDPMLDSFAAAVRLMLQQKSGNTEYSYEGRKIIAGYKEISSLNWILVLSLDRSEYLQSLIRMRIFSLIISVFFLFTGILISVILARSLSGPVKSMLPVIERMAEGDLTGRIRIGSSDEIGVMSERFNVSMAALRGTIGMTRDAIAGLAGMLQEIGEYMMEAAASMNQITVNIKKLSSEGAVQAESVQYVNTLTDRLQEETGVLSNAVTVQAEALEAASSSAEQMVANVKSAAGFLAENFKSVEILQSAAGEGREEMKRLLEVVGKIELNSDGLLEAVSVIQSISSQTNLLSMNAAIEAAHAGEAGRGFAVVADEIRKLAETSSSQGKKISTVLKGLKNDISSVSGSAGVSDNHFSGIAGRIDDIKRQSAEIQSSMQEQSQGGILVLDSMMKMKEISIDVSTAVDVMASACNDVVSRMQGLETAAREIRLSQEQMSDGAEKVNDSVQKINLITQDARVNMGQLTEEVDKFRL